MYARSLIAKGLPCLALAFSLACGDEDKGGMAGDTVVRNNGSEPAQSILVRYYAGDPSQGGSVLHEETFAGPLGPGEHAMLTASIPAIAGGRTITIYAVVDPERAIDECDEADNKDHADNSVRCQLGPD